MSKHSKQWQCCASISKGAEFRNPGRRSVGLCIRVIVVPPPEYAAEINAATPCFLRSPF